MNKIESNIIKQCLTKIKIDFNLNKNEKLPDFFLFIFKIFRNKIFQIEIIFVSGSRRDAGPPQTGIL